MEKQAFQKKTDNIVKIKTINSLEKIFYDEEPKNVEKSGSMLKNQRYNFQIAFYTESMLKDVCINTYGDLSDFVTVRRVEYVPSVVVNNIRHDDYILTDKSGLFPDVLVEDDSGYTAPAHKWSAFWVTVQGDVKIAPGEHVIRFSIICGEDGAVAAETEYKLKIINLCLPENDICISSWMHLDCMAATHGVKVFGKEFYDIFDKYLVSYVKHGHNTLLVPLFTPPLDTAIGKERPTVQSVDVSYVGGKYVFDFTKLDKYLDFILSRGIKYVEFSHLFTQWGAHSCPKIVADVDGETKKIFGWEISSTDEEYLTFLDSFLTELSIYIDKKGIADTCFFHLSDELPLCELERYKKLYAFVRQRLGKYRFADTTSEIGFIKAGVTDVPIVSVDRADEFLAEKGDCWVYYCNAQCVDYLPNRFLSMPSERNRILGFQLYLSGAKGFLQWGFNYYFRSQTDELIDPYRVTDAGNFFPSGDSFIIYPHKSGVYDSLRLEVFYDGIQDYLALKLLERYIGKQRVVSMLEEGGVKGFTVYPRSDEWHIGFRNKINDLLSVFTSEQKEKAEC